MSVDREFGPGADGPAPGGFGAGPAPGGFGAAPGWVGAGEIAPVGPGPAGADTGTDAGTDTGTAAATDTGTDAGSGPAPGGPVSALLGAIAMMARLACGTFAVILVGFVLCAVGRAEPSDWLVTLIGNWSAGLTLGLAGLFEPESVDFQVIADYGVPAVAWLLLGWAVGRIARRPGASA